MTESFGTVQEAIELQRGAIAAEIHDSLLPYLFAARMRLETLIARTEQVSDDSTRADPLAQHSDPEANLREFVPHELKIAVETLQTAMLVGRELISQLYPADMGMSWNEHLMSSFERLTSHDASHLIIEGDFDDWVHDPERRLAARRIAQEAIRNAVRHGKAREIEVLVNRPEDNATEVVIRDNGIGFEPKFGHQGFGLRIMQMRATQIHATLAIESGRGGPTVVTLRLND